MPRGSMAASYSGNMTLPNTATADGVVEVQIGPERAGERLDRVVAGMVATLSRSRLQTLVREGAVKLAGAAITDPGRKVKAGETYSVTIPAPVPAEPLAEPIPLRVVYEDDDLIVVDKPAGLVVHPAAGHHGGTLVNALIAHCGNSLSGIGGVRRPGIVHRLDKGTSGLLVVAKTDHAHQGLSDQFKSHGADGRLERRYLALVWGAPQRERATIDAPLARSRASRTKIAVTKGEHGRRAVTHMEVLERFSDHQGKPVASLVALTLETGRTHQVRVHMAHAGHPVIGDPTYATAFQTRSTRLGPAARQALSRLDRQALHATSLIIEHPRSEKRLSFTSEPPCDMRRLLEALRIDRSTDMKGSGKRRV